MKENRLQDRLYGIREEYSPWNSSMEEKVQSHDESNSTMTGPDLVKSSPQRKEQHDGHPLKDSPR